MSPPCVCHLNSSKVCQFKAFITGVCNCESGGNTWVPVDEVLYRLPYGHLQLVATCGARGHAMLLTPEAPDHNDCKDHAIGQHKVCAATVVVVRQNSVSCHECHENRSQVGWWMCQQFICYVHLAITACAVPPLLMLLPPALSPCDEICVCMAVQ